MLNIEYLTDQNGKTKAVVIPIELWQKLFSNNAINFDNLAELIEDYCLNKAMDEAKLTPLLDREKALKFLEENIKN
ncbi:hypothetical protein [Geminocystis sp. GBBB08]|uniref:hypothetical protein n=1 Tax=Geminocystis sp. GBBB08 TaxID=2604140 RepID=UPI0027E27C79|nr:hypothetical protein [Geminocystis sp. GBBB08]MBL1208386.1 hemagglutinin [Geminocystis sp. GBBB08]